MASMIRFGMNTSPNHGILYEDQLDDDEQMTLSPFKRRVMMSSPIALFGKKKVYDHMVESDDEESVKIKEIPKLQDNHFKFHSTIDLGKRNITSLDKSIEQLLHDRASDDEDDDLLLFSGNNNKTDCATETLSPPSGEFGIPPAANRTRRRRKPRNHKKPTTVPLDLDVSNHIMSPRRQKGSSLPTYLPEKLSPKSSPSAKPKVKSLRKKITVDLVVTGDEKEAPFDTLVKSEHIDEKQREKQRNKLQEERLCRTQHVTDTPRRRSKKTLRRSSHTGAEPTSPVQHRTVRRSSLTNEEIPSPKERRSKKAALRRTPGGERAAYLPSLNVTSPRKSINTPIRMKQRTIVFDQSPTTVLPVLGALDTLPEAVEPPSLETTSPDPSTKPLVRPRRRSPLHISIYDKPKEDRQTTEVLPSMARSGSDTCLVKSEHAVVEVSSPSGHRRHLELQF